MKQWTERKAHLAGILAVFAGAFAAQHGCGGDETTAGASCSPPCGAGQECVDGQCECAGGTTLCGGVCVDTSTDPGNCGYCGTICDAAEACVAGACGCPDGLAACSSGCADTTTDKLNCGQCNFTCPGAQSCVGGQCVCPDGTEACFDQCVDTTSNTQFCGDCNTSCDSGDFCINSVCETVSGCDQVPMDQYEGNDDCGLARLLPEAAEGAAPVTVADATLHHIDGSPDVDYYSILAKEGFHSCSLFPPESQCYFVFDIAFTPPDTDAYATYQMCVSEGTCGAGETCTTPSDWNAGASRYELSLSWEGLCGFTDDGQMYVKIVRNGGEENCAQYSLEYAMSYTDEICP